MKFTFFILLALAFSTVALADCLSTIPAKIEKIEKAEKKKLKKLKEAITEAYRVRTLRISSTKAILDDSNYPSLRKVMKEVHKRLQQEINITQIVTAVVKANETEKFCEALTIQSYAEEMALLLKINPEFLLDNDLRAVINPMFYRKRSEPVLNIGLVYYGDYYSEADLARIQALLEERFAISTNQVIKIKTIFKAIIPYKNDISQFPDYSYPNVTDPVRLQRFWYYDNVNAKIMTEVYEVVKASPTLREEVFNIDTLAIVTGAQFDGIGFANGRVAVTENPMDIGWANAGGWVDYVTDEKVVDELLHEIGHTMFLDHSSNQCQLPGLTPQEVKACCEASPGNNDVMSACRTRAKVDQNFFYKYGTCNQRNIKNKILPAMLSGGAWNIADREKCL